MSAKQEVEELKKEKEEIDKEIIRYNEDLDRVISKLEEINETFDKLKEKAENLGMDIEGIPKKYRRFYRTVREISNIFKRAIGKEVEKEPETASEIIADLAKEMNNKFLELVGEYKVLLARIPTILIKLQKLKEMLRKAGETLKEEKYRIMLEDMEKYVQKQMEYLENIEPELEEQKKLVEVMYFHSAAYTSIAETNAKIMKAKVGTARALENYSKLVVYGQEIMLEEDMAARKSTEYFKNNIAPVFTWDAIQKLKEHEKRIKEMKKGYFE